MLPEAHVSDPVCSGSLSLPEVEQAILGIEGQCQRAVLLPLVVTLEEPQIEADGEAGSDRTLKAIDEGHAPIRPAHEVRGAKLAGHLQGGRDAGLPGGRGVEETVVAGSLQPQRAPARAREEADRGCERAPGGRRPHSSSLAAAPSRRPRRSKKRSSFSARSDSGT